MEVNPNIHFLALGRLYEFCANKRFHLIKNEFIEDEIGLKALEFNNEIKNKIGVNLFEAISEKNLLDYEKILNKYVSDSARKILPYEQSGDEIQLLQNQIEYAKDKLSAFNIKLAAPLKPYLKNIHITVPDIINACKHPDHVVYTYDDYSFFLTKKIKVGSKERIIFAHLAYDNEDLQSPQFTSQDNPYFKRFHSRGGFSIKQLPTDLIIRMVLVFTYDKYYYLLNNPIRLFIKGLDLYGVKTEINNVIKKFHKNVILPPHINPFASNFYKLILEGPGHIRTVSMTKPSPISATIYYLYSINMDNLSEDLLKGKI